MFANGWYMQSRRLRALNLPNSWEVDADYNRLIYYNTAYFVYTLLWVVDSPIMSDINYKHSIGTRMSFISELIHPIQFDLINWIAGC